MPYLMAGFRLWNASREIGLACARRAPTGGARGAVLGPLAAVRDHAAATEALQPAPRPLWCWRCALSIAEADSRGAEAYANLVLGHEGFLDKPRAAGASGLIVPDLPHDEAGELRASATRAGLALVPLAAPSSTDERLPRSAGRARVRYTVSLAGTTRRARRAAAVARADRGGVRAASSVPVAVGFRHLDAAQARAVGEIARRGDRRQPAGEARARAGGGRGSLVGGLAEALASR